MKFLKFLVALVVICAVILVVVAFTLPADLTIQRSVVIAAPSAEIHPHVENMQNWRNWSPWNQERDPSLKYTYEGPESGVGSKQMWDGKDGQGSMEVTSSSPEKGIEYDITMMEKTEKGSITYEKAEGGTRVVWEFNSTDMGPVNRLFMKAFQGVLESDFEQGLDNLKQYIEKGQVGSTSELGAPPPEETSEG